MKRGFVLDQDEIVRAIARGVVEERLPPGRWICSVELILDGPARRFGSCTVIAASSDGQKPEVGQVAIDTWCRVDDLKKRVGELEDIRDHVRRELRSLATVLRDAPKRGPKRTPAA